jgi:hypothetical protein
MFGVPNVPVSLLRVRCAGCNVRAFNVRGAMFNVVQPPRPSHLSKSDEQFGQELATRNSEPVTLKLATANLEPFLRRLLNLVYVELALLCKLDDAKEIQNLNDNVSWIDLMPADASKICP